MASLTTSLNHDQVEDLVGDISAAQLVSASTTDLTYALTYSGDDTPQASTLHVSGNFTLSGGNVTGGTVSSFDFLSGAGASLLLVGGISLDFSQADSLLKNPDTFEDFVDHLGEANDDNLEIGDDGDDDMHGGQGDDDMLGGGGDDHMHGGRGNDHLSGGDGDDDLSGGLGDDHLDGGRGSHDSVSFDSAKKIVVDLAAGTAKGEGNDTLVGIEDVAGTHGSDVIVGDANANDLLGDSGNDKLSGLAGDDHLVGDDGNDKLDGGDGNDLLEAGRGNDQLDGGAGNDILDGGDGNDKLSGGAGDDDIDGGAGNDNISTGDGLNIVVAGSGNDKILGGNDADNVSGGDGNDTIMTAGGDDLIDGGAGKDNIKAGDGNDRIDGGDGDDNMAGGAGDDTYWVSSAKDKIVEHAGEGNDTVVSSASFSLAKLANVENIELTGIANIDATGNAADNILTGNDGNNALDGGAGNDLLIGGAGADALTGGAGNDTFVFDNLAVRGVDTVKDFTHGSDLLALDADVFTALAGSVDLSANVVVGTAAIDANDFLVFDSSTGALFYDQDGNGAGAAVQIATLTGVTTVSGSDFTIV